MRVLFDASVLLAAMIATHPAHDTARAALESALTGEVDGVAAATTLAEVYAALTGLDTDPPIRPLQALRLMDENLSKLTIVPLNAADHRIAIRRAVEARLSGTAVHDAMVGQAAVRAGADRLLSLDPGRYRPLGEDVAGLVG